MNKEISFPQENNGDNKILFEGAKISRSKIDENWILTQKDIELGQKFYQEERIYPLNLENMFKGGLESILSRAEKFIKQKRLFNILLENNLDTPEKIIDNLPKLENLFQNSDYKPVYPEKTVKNIFLFSSWWSNSNLPWEIIESKSKQDGKTGIEFRDRIAKLKSPDKAPGMGAKIASLFISLCGFEDVVIIDQHMCYFLEDHGHFPWKMPDRKERGGLWLSRYKDLEKIMTNMAIERDLSPTIFQLSLWNKYRQRNNKHKNQDKLF